MPTLATLQYNGVNLLYGKIRSFRQRLVMSEDGVRPLYTHVTLAVSCVVNLAATQPNPAAPIHPATAIIALRRRLLIPQRKLYVWAGTRLVIESPQLWADGRSGDVDANNGPVPVSFDVDDIIADGCIFATFTIQTWLAESCLGVPGFPPPMLLSNQFEQSSEVSFPEYLETRSTNGRAVFRTDFLAAVTTRVPPPGFPAAAAVGRPVTPADFAGWVMPPIPSGYQRESVLISETSDGTALTWSCRDVEVPPRWGLQAGNGIVKCDGNQELTYDTGLLFTNAMSIRISLEVFGYPWTTNSNLVTALIILLETLRNRQGLSLSQNVPGRLTARGRRMLSNATIRVNFRQRHASLSIAQRLTGTLSRIAGALGPSQLDNINNYAEDFGPSLGTNPAGGVGVATRTAPQPVPRADPNAAGTTAARNPLVGIMHQLLSDPCTMPPQGIVPPRNATLNPP